MDGSLKADGLEDTEKRCLRITDISVEDRPVKKPEKVKKASRKTRRVADCGNILRSNHDWLLLVCFMIIQTLIQASSVIMNTNESSTDVSPGKSSHQDKEHASASTSTFQSPD